MDELREREGKVGLRWKGEERKREEKVGCGGRVKRGRGREGRGWLRWSR